jgi:hypothetical protein
MLLPHIAGFISVASAKIFRSARLSALFCGSFTVIINSRGLELVFLVFSSAMN